MTSPTTFTPMMFYLPSCDGTLLTSNLTQREGDYRASASMGDIHDLTDHIHTHGALSAEESRWRDRRLRAHTHTLPLEEC